jgi:hypothetical protein
MLRTLLIRYFEELKVSESGHARHVPHSACESAIARTVILPGFEVQV